MCTSLAGGSLTSTEHIAEHLRVWNFLPLNGDVPQVCRVAMEHPLTAEYTVGRVIVIVEELAWGRADGRNLRHFVYILIVAVVAAMSSSSSSSALGPLVVGGIVSPCAPRVVGRMAFILPRQRYVSQQMQRRHLRQRGRPLCLDPISEWQPHITVLHSDEGVECAETQHHSKGALRKHKSGLGWVRAIRTNTGTTLVTVATLAPTIRANALCLGRV